MVWTSQSFDWKDQSAEVDEKRYKKTKKEYRET